MRIKYDKPKNQRIKKGTTKYNGRRILNFWGIECSGYWWHDKTYKWIKLEDWHNEGNVSTINLNIKNLKQAIRHVKKHSYLPKGIEFRLASNLRGYDIYIKP
jgi:hypothetical protein